MPRVLYKYLSPAPDEKTLPWTLRNQMFLATDPREFNDLFEVRPYFDQARHDYFAAGHEAFYERALGVKHSLLENRSMVGVPWENVSGFADTLNQKFTEAVGKRYRVLCLALTPSCPTMWAHYTNQYQGVVIGFDVDDPEFFKGLDEGGFPITYTDDRVLTKLPMAFYRFPPVETYDIRGQLVNHDMEEIENDGVIIYFHQYKALLEEAHIRALTMKACSWQYEKEVRFIYDLSARRDRLREDGGRFFTPIPKTAIKEIIVGHKAKIRAVEEIVALHRAGAYGDAKLMFTECHPSRYEIQPHETNADYLLDYFKVILPNK